MPSTANPTLFIIWGVIYFYLNYITAERDGVVVPQMEETFICNHTIPLTNNASTIPAPHSGTNQRLPCTLSTSPATPRHTYVTEHSSSLLGLQRPLCLPGTPSRQLRQHACNERLLCLWHAHTIPLADGTSNAIVPHNRTSRR